MSGPPLAVGAAAPDFTLRDQHGRAVSLSDFRGEKAVLLVFYPFAFSPVCTGELQALRDRQADFDDDRVALLAVSCDPMFALRAAADQDRIGFRLLADFWPHGEVARAYGVLDERRGCPARSTFLVDRDGVVRWSVHSPVGEARDLEEYSRALAGLPGLGG